MTLLLNPFLHSKAILFFPPENATMQRRQQSQLEAVTIAMSGDLEKNNLETTRYLQSTKMKNILTLVEGEV